MSGIAGCLAVAEGTRPDTDWAVRAARRMAHRGPDDEGVFSDGAVALAARRLAVVDPSAGGHQPMRSADGRFWMVYNGEIYNYAELAQRLRARGVQLRGGSDSEVLLETYAAEGKDALRRLRGMYAFAIWDTQNKELFCARDPFGIKPLYYTLAEGGRQLRFASERKALTGPGEVSVIDPDALRRYLSFQYVPAPATMTPPVRLLPPGHFLTATPDGPVDVFRYWRPILHPAKSPSPDTPERILVALRDSVAAHLRSDVPVGAALSGGIDSSAVVMAMRALQGDSLDIHAFSYTAADDRLNEEKWIDLVGAQSGSTVHKIRLSPAELVNDLDAIIAAQDEPFGSTSILAQYHVYKLARRTGIKVTMDGQGADEMLGGYPVFYAARLASLVKAGKLGQALSFLAATGPYGRSTLLKAGRWLLPSGLQAPARRLVGERLDPPWLNAAWFEARGASLAEALPRPGRQVLKAALADSFAQRSLPALLRYGDRNSMAHSVESRVPFLCTPLVEFIFSLPEHLLIDAQGTTKAVFRAAMRGIVPDAVLDRRDKIGFATPQTDWLTAMSPWVERVLESEAAKAVPLLNQTVMRGQWAQAKASGQMPGEMWRWLNLIRWAEQTGVEFV